MSYPSAPDSLAKSLGYAGLIPFVLLAALLWIVQSDLRPWLTIALTSYAALIATFLGGMHWGIAAAQSFGQRGFHLIWGIVPSLARSHHARLCGPATARHAAFGLLSR
jgi:Protein of unknown function (DUF3429)